MMREFKIDKSTVIKDQPIKSFLHVHFKNKIRLFGLVRMELMENLLDNDGVVSNSSRGKKGCLRRGDDVVQEWFNAISSKGTQPVSQI